MTDNFKPNNGTEYWVAQFNSFSGGFGTVSRHRWIGDHWDQTALNEGRCFRSEEEAQDCVERKKLENIKNG